MIRYTVLLAASACAAIPPPSPNAAPTPVAIQPSPTAIPTPPPSTPPPPPLPLGELALATHRSFFDAMRAHDAKALSALYSPNASVDLGPGVPVAHGPDAVATLAQTLWTAFPDARIQWRRLLQSGSTIAVEFAWTGTNTGVLGEALPTKKVVGTAGLFIERFATSGLIEAQRVYIDTQALTDDLKTRMGKPHPFAGLPTMQTTVLDHAAATPDDDVTMRTVTASFTHGSYGDAVLLATPSSTWSDSAKEHVASGKGAITGWVSFLSRTFPSGKTPPVDLWSTGDAIIAEWRGPSGSTAESATVRSADVVTFEGGHILEVRTYRSSQHTTGKGTR